MVHDCGILILGAGFSGLSASYHFGHDQCVILEKNNHPFGHCSSHSRDGVIWDEGPHVSFTKSEYVRSLLEESVSGSFAEYDVTVGNYYKGSWINHPAQVNLYQVPEPLRSECLNSFLTSRTLECASPDNYGEWLEMAFGEVFSREFPYAYTRKYWTCEPESLETSWVGERVLCPKEEDVIEGSKSELLQKKHYITKVRYPKEGGYEVFGRVLSDNANIEYDCQVKSIDLENKKVLCTNGSEYAYQRLISTIPLPLFVHMVKQTTGLVRDAADKLSCTSGYLVNVVVPHKATRPENWIYVYDEDKLSTRITFAEKLDNHESQKDYCAIQVEVYYSKYKRMSLSVEEIENKVIDELYEMGLIDITQIKCRSQLKSHVTNFKWGNVIFDHARKGSLNKILEWLSKYGLVREDDDLLHSSNWNSSSHVDFGTLALAGRFGQWKYYWSDDCILRGKQIAE